MPYAQLVVTKRPGQEPSLNDLVSDIPRTYEAAVGWIRSAPDPQQAFDAATKLASLLRDLADSAAEIRAETVARIWKTEELSVAGLAERIGVSKARAGQLLATAKTRKEEAIKTKEENDNG